MFGPRSIRSDSSGLGRVKALTLLRVCSIKEGERERETRLIVVMNIGIKIESLFFFEK